MTALRAFLRRHRRIALDTSVFIYQLEANPRYLGLTDPVFARRGEQRVNEFCALLATYPNLEWIATSLPIADLAAGIRAKQRIRTLPNERILPPFPADRRLLFWRAQF